MIHISYYILVLLYSLLLRRALGSPSSPLGSIGVLNNCEIPVYMKITRQGDSPVSVLEPGEAYRETYQFLAEGGTSMKLAKNSENLAKGEQQVQLEYTCTDQCYVDFSMIDNADKFPGQNTTLTLTPSDPACDTLICIAGDTTCRDAYFKPTDNQAVRACSLQADWSLTLCARRGAQ